MNADHSLPSSGSSAWPIGVAVWTDPGLFLVIVLVVIAILLFAGYVRLVIRIARAFLFALLALVIVGMCFALLVSATPHRGGDVAMLGPFYGLAIAMFVISPFVLLVAFVTVLVRDGRKHGKGMLERTAEPWRTRVGPACLLFVAVMIVLAAR